MLIIGVCGASGSGKTTLSNELNAALNERGCSSVIINQDTYYYDFPENSLEERKKLNYDHPKIFHHDALLKDTQDLLKGNTIDKKRYDFSMYKSAPPAEKIEPADVLIIEGIHAFYDERLTDLMFLKLFISVEPDICLLRRISRDIKERQRSIDSIADQYIKTVKPMYDRYVRGYVNRADVIVSRGGKNARIVEILAGYIQGALKKEL